MHLGYTTWEDHDKWQSTRASNVHWRDGIAVLNARRGAALRRAKRGRREPIIATALTPMDNVYGWAKNMDGECTWVHRLQTWKWLSREHSNYNTSQINLKLGNRMKYYIWYDNNLSNMKLIDCIGFRTCLEVIYKTFKQDTFVVLGRQAIKSIMDSPTLLLVDYLVFYSLWLIYYSIDKVIQYWIRYIQHCWHGRRQSLR